MMIMVFTGALLTATLAAQEDIHVHGHATLMIGAEATGRIEAILEAPSDSFWGFEYSPRNDEERIAVEGAHRDLSRSSILSFTSNAGCELLSVDISGETDEHDDHAHEDGDHEEHDAGGHQDVAIHYVFNCSAPQNIDDISTTLFEYFPRLEEVEGVFVDPDLQTGFEFSPSQRSVRLPR